MPQGELYLESPKDGGGVDELESVTLLLAPVSAAAVAATAAAAGSAALLLLLLMRSSKSDSGFRFLEGRPTLFFRTTKGVVPPESLGVVAAALAALLFLVALPPPPSLGEPGGVTSSSPLWVALRLHFLAPEGVPAAESTVSFSTEEARESSGDPEELTSWFSIRCSKEVWLSKPR